MNRHSLIAFQGLAWLALAFTLVGDFALDHSHGHPASDFLASPTSGAQPLHTGHDDDPSAAPPLNPFSLASDADHSEHSARATLEFGPCGVCRSIERSWALSSATHPWAIPSVAVHVPGRADTLHAHTAHGRSNPSRAPPSATLV